MAKNRFSAKRNSMFTKNPDVLPFFSIHPKTKVGSIIRIAVSVFVILMVILAFLSSRGLMMIWLNKINFLIYVVPISGMFALLIVALFKRMKTTFGRIAVPGMLAFFIFSVIMTLATAFSQFNSFAAIPKAMLESEGHDFVILRECIDPADTEYQTITNKDGTQEVVVKNYNKRIDAHLFTVRVPKSVEGETYEITGEIRLPSASYVEYNIDGEWTDADTLRIFISKDSSGLGTGEITVDFTPGETKAESPAAYENALYKSMYTSPDGKRDVYLYRQDDYMYQKVPSYLSMEEQDFVQAYIALPRTLFIFAKTNVRSEGAILIEPYGTLNGFQVEWLEKDSVVRFTATEDSVGATGEVVVYLKEKANAQSGNTPAPAETPAENAEISN